MEAPSYPSQAGIDGKGPSPEFIWLRTEKAIGDSSDALHRIAIHEKECATRFVEVRNDLAILHFWLKVGTIALIVLFLSTFLHLDALQIIKLISPSATLP